MRLREIGEFGLIKKIYEWVDTGSDIIKGIGDDAAVIKYKKGSYILFTTDMLIEDVHFRLKDAKPFLIGRKALAVNISDIAAMGGVPKYGVVAFGVSPDFELSFVKEIFQGIKKLANKFDIDIVGGDTDKSDKLIINISLIGEVEKRNLVLRSGAKAGDAIFVTGSLGGSYKSGKHLTFMPRAREARFLVKNFKVNSMIDISDGLSSDLTRLIESSNVGAFIDGRLIPLSKNCKIENALSDGEDFELLFTVPEKESNSLIKKWPYDTKLTKIGSITGPKRLIKLLTNKGAQKMKEKGFKHF